MARFSGNVGYDVDVEVEPGLWVHNDSPTVRKYFGDISHKSSRFQSADKINDDLTFSMQVSIIADQFAYDNFSQIRFVEYMGVRWKVTHVEVEPPRLILSFGGVYS